MVTLVYQDYEFNKKRYKKEETTIKKHLDEAVVIDHVGSTAIPNIYGKNILDILVGVPNKNIFNETKKQLLNLGYKIKNESKDDIYQFLSTSTNETTAKDTHIHLVITGTKRYDDFLILRDYLLNNEKEAQAYSNHKKELIERGITERKEYRSVKSLYVEKLIKRARKNMVKTQINQ